MTWQPIETAPKDDGLQALMVHVYGPDPGDRLITIASWSHDAGAWQDSGGFTINASHWMPLPEPPQAIVR